MLLLCFSILGSLLLGCRGNCGIWCSLFNLSSERLYLSVFLLLLAEGGGILLLDTLLHGDPDIEYLLLLLGQNVASFRLLGHHASSFRDKIFVLLVLLCADFLQHLSLLLWVHNRSIRRLLQVAQLLHSVHMGDGSWQVRLLLVVLIFGEVLLAQSLRLVDGRPAVKPNLPDVRVLSCKFSCWLLDYGCLLLALLLV